MNVDVHVNASLLILLKYTLKSSFNIWTIII